MRFPRVRFTVKRMMVAVACLGMGLGVLRMLHDVDPIFGGGTVYSAGYHESRFNGLRVGMSKEAVETIMGRPLKKVPWNEHMGPDDEEMWFYSDQPNYLANFWRRWVLIEKGKVAVVINDFWYD